MVVYFSCYDLLSTTKVAHADEVRVEDYTEREGVTEYASPGRDTAPASVARAWDGRGGRVIFDEVCLASPLQPRTS